MTNENYTHLSVLVDRSGSMSGLEADMIGGLKSFFADQAELDGQCLVDYSQFDTVYENVFTDTLVASAEPVLEPRGATALLDALGRNIKELGAKFAAMAEDERPGKVLVIVVTDGYENASLEFTKDQVKALIEEQETKYNWDFVFLGANMDAVAEGAKYGVSKGSSLTYDTSNIGQTYTNLSGYVTRSRSGVVGNSFTEEERDSSVATSS